jgi:hypothetical protein
MCGQHVITGLPATERRGFHPSAIQPPGPPNQRGCQAEQAKRYERHPCSLRAAKQQSGKSQIAIISPHCNSGDLRIWKNDSPSQSRSLEGMLQGVRGRVASVIARRVQGRLINGDPRGSIGMAPSGVGAWPGSVGHASGRLGLGLGVEVSEATAVELTLSWVMDWVTHWCWSTRRAWPLAFCRYKATLSLLGALGRGDWWRCSYFIRLDMHSTS